MSIGFFDSGVGGLSVLFEALKILPNHNYIYYADTKNVPYGQKSKNELTRIILNAVDFIVEKNVNAVVVACNTATSVAIEKLRERYKIPIIGMEPAIKPAVNFVEPEKRVIVFATELTLKEDKFIKLLKKIDTNHIIDYKPLGKLVTFAENFEFNDDVVIPYLKKELQDIEIHKYGAVVLGCTHFSFFKKHFREIFPKGTTVFDGNKGTVNNLKNQITEKGKFDQGKGRIEYYSSGILQPEGIEQKFFVKLDEYNSVEQ